MKMLLFLLVNKNQANMLREKNRDTLSNISNNESTPSVRTEKPKNSVKRQLFNDDVDTTPKNASASEGKYYTNTTNIDKELI